MTDCEISFNVTLEARCIRCRLKRPAPEGSELILLDSDASEDGVKTTCVVSTDTPCECGETRVKVRAGIALA